MTKLDSRGRAHHTTEEMIAEMPEEPAPAIGSGSVAIGGIDYDK